MAFSDHEKVRIRHHLGFLNVKEAAVFAVGVPAAVETQYLIETAMDKVLAAAEVEVRNHVAILDGIEQQMIGDLELLAVNKVGNIEINPDEQSKLKRAYQHWQRSLSNLLGIEANPFDRRFAGGGLNVPVQS